MPTLPPRYTDDSTALWKAAIAAGWEIERLVGWRVPEGLADREPVLYGEPLFAAVVASELKLALLEPPLDWLPSLPYHYCNRDIEFTTLGAARLVQRPSFIKPADDKAFAATVYANGELLPSVESVPDNTPVLISEPVDWEVEFRCFARPSCHRVNLFAAW